MVEPQRIGDMMAKLVQDAQATGNPPSIMDMLGKTSALAAKMEAGAAVGASSSEMDLLRFLMKTMNISRGQAQNMVAMNSPEAAKAAAEAVLSAADTPAKAKAMLAAGAKLGLVPSKTDLDALNKMFDKALFGPGQNLPNAAMPEGITGGAPIPLPGPASYNVAKPIEILPPPRLAVPRPAVPRVPDMLDARSAAAQATRGGQRLVDALREGEAGAEAADAAATLPAPSAAAAGADVAGAAAGGAAKTAAAAAEIGWKEAYEKGVWAMLKKAAPWMYGESAKPFGKLVGLVGPQVLMSYLMHQLMDIGWFMPGGKSAPERATEREVQKMEGQTRMIEAQLPSEALLSAQAALAPAQQEAQAAQGQAMQSGALADMGWM